MLIQCAKCEIKNELTRKFPVLVKKSLFARQEFSIFCCFVVVKMFTMFSLSSPLSSSQKKYIRSGCKFFLSYVQVNT